VPSPIRRRKTLRGYNIPASVIKHLTLLLLSPSKPREQDDRLAGQPAGELLTR